MVRLVVVACVVLLGGAVTVAAQAPDSLRASSSYLDGYQSGEVHGRAVGTGAWFAAGLASGFVVPVVGNAVTYVVAGSDGAGPARGAGLLLQAYGNRDAGFEQGFHAGYKDTLLARRRRSALTGGLVGTTAYTVLVLTLLAGSLGN
jgi:hypothetical protein